MLQCRQCGSEVASDAREKKCRDCGELFPFECAVCGKHLRPPIPDFPIERYFNEQNQPLCADHYQRQCPECSKWFRADENPGYFMCADCTRNPESALQADAGSDDYDEAPPKPKSGLGCSVMMSLCVCGAGALFYGLRVWL